MKLNLIYIQIVWLSISCGDIEGSKTFSGLEISQGIKASEIDSVPVEITTKSTSKSYDFTVKYLNNGSSFSLNLRKDDEHFEYETKTFKIEGISHTIIRLDNEKIAITDGSAYYYLLSDGRPLVIKSKDWPSYSAYITNNRDRQLLDLLVQDETCFFKCKSIDALPPPEVIEELDTLMNLDPDNPNIPDWIYDIYPDSSNSDNGNTNQVVLAYKILNDSVSYCIIETNDLTCGRTFVATQINQKEFVKIEIGYNCDHDQSIPYYSWKDYEILNSGLIRTVEYTECIMDSAMAKQDEYSDIDCIKGTISIATKNYEIKPDGNIFIYNPSKVEVHSEKSNSKAKRNRN